MKTIPLNEALDLLALAYAIDVNDSDEGWLGTSYTLHVDEDEEDEFLHLVATNEEGLMWDFVFHRSANQTVTIDGDIMTLHAHMLARDGVDPKVDIRMMVPLQLEACSKEIPPPVREALVHVRCPLPDENAG